MPRCGCCEYFVNKLFEREKNIYIQKGALEEVTFQKCELIIIDFNKHSMTLSYALCIKEKK